MKFKETEHGTLIDWEDDPQDRAPMTEAIDALRAATDKIIILRTALRGLVEKIQAEPMPTGEPSESVWLGRQQVADELKAAIAAAEAETEEK